MIVHRLGVQFCGVSKIPRGVSKIQAKLPSNQCCVDTKEFHLNARIPCMPQFVIEREIPGAGSLTEDQIREVSLHSLETLKSMGPHIQWLHSYVTEDKVYCVYVAPDEETIREHARKSGIRADRVSAVRSLIDPAAFS